ncbi:hypothetical protein LSTR_LSTR002038 [Laodelphax striatellus]|uniref:HIG1 domain-containing protein n=1 Tax=Laodelphax striatellus TaxID=195883 RepID=A0A482XHD0_LAOST|nr:hypothetical protein LSTR_LSTR002038 [Laodelphax striatellus]
MGSNKKEDLSDLQWITLREDMDEVYHEESMVEKFTRKFREEPLVPSGAIATASCLGVGLYYFMKGNSQNQQYMMRARVLAQAFTVGAFVVGMTAAVVKPASKT